MPEEFPGEPLTVAQIEAAHMYPDDGRVPHVPFGFMNHAWERFKAEMQPGDLIYEFSNSPEAWAALAGREGYVLVRNGEPVRQLVTAMS